MKLAILGVVMFCSLIAIAQKQSMVLSMPSLKCEQTTDDGEDEVYLLILWKKSDGSKGSIRMPGIPNAWKNMNDGDKLNNDLDWGELLAFDLQLGQRIDILGMIMENDDGTLQQYAKFGEELFRSNFFNEIKTNLNAGNSSDIKKILARIAGTYSLKNPDDWIGSFVCAFLLSREGVKENYGAVFNENNPTDKMHGANPKNNSKTTSYHFGGDGSSYFAKLRLTVKLNAIRR